MRTWIIAAIAAAALAAGNSTEAGAHMAGSARAGGFAHGYTSFRARLFAGNRFGFDFGRGFRYGGYGYFAPFAAGRFAGGGEVAVGDDYAGNYDESYADDESPGLENMHFRVQDSFGPWDIGRPPPPEGPYDSGPWDGAPMNSGAGYDSGAMR
ncbi:MAG: hypothetical protein ACREHV_08985 [Rhizomicrobium sp.]